MFLDEQAKEAISSHFGVAKRHVRLGKGMTVIAGERFDRWEGNFLHRFLA